MKIVLASGNSGKLREISAALAGCGAELTPQSEFGVQPAPEPHPTFLENALAKARHAALQTGLPALADDSGIAVHKLGGIPGVRSARFAGENPTDQQNNQKLLAALRQFPSPQDRRAFYCAVTILVLSPQDPAPLVAEGFWHGVITQEPRGENGFGYDPVFLDENIGKTGGEMSVAEKEKVSHRGQALRDLVRKMKMRGFFPQE